MEKLKNGKEVPGTDTPKPLSLEEVRRFVKHDVSSMMHLLDAIYRDQATMDMIADILYGRYLNAKHKDELEKQTKLEV